jgi:hypothetical protein
LARSAVLVSRISDSRIKELEALVFKGTESGSEVGFLPHETRKERKGEPAGQITLRMKQKAFGSFITA